MSNDAIRRVGIGGALVVLAVPVFVRIRRWLLTRNDRVGITPIPIP